MTISLDDFHDSILTEISIEWETGLTRIKLIPYRPYINSSEVTILAEGVFNFDLGREFPWGKSKYINSIGWKVNEAEKQIIEIQMQSGDVIIVGGNKITWFTE